MRGWLVSLAAGAALLAAPLSLSAQNHPWPGSTSEPNVICNGCPGANAGLPLTPYGPPIKDHAGRYLDSSRTKDWQPHTGKWRTLRAALARADESRGRVYMKIGTAFVMYDKNKFFANLGGTLSSHHHGENILTWDSAVYPEAVGSGWKTRVMDGQEFMGDFDLDDRGYNYIAYTIWGWGIVKDAGSFGSPVYQDFEPQVSPSRIISLKGASGKYYVITTNAKGSSIQVYDASNPSAPKGVRVAASNIVDWAKLRVGSSDLIAISGKSGISIYDADAFAMGGPAAKTLPGYSHVTAGDGAFYGYRGGSGPNAIARITGGSTAASFSAVDFPVRSGLTPSFVRYGADHITAAGYPGTGEFRVWKIEGSGARELDVSSYFKEHYILPPSGYAKPDGYTADIRDAVVTKHNGKTYLIYSNHGIGDVYELQGKDAVSVAIDSSLGYGTKNGYSPNRNDGPYYGDLVPFRSSFPTALLSSVLWNFDNAEAGTAATPLLALGSTRYQYRGLASSSQITRSRNVSAADPSDPTNADSVTLNLKAPQARIAWHNPATQKVEVVTGGAPRTVVLGDHFVDASDGVIESHVARWTDGAIAINATPAAPYPVTECGAGSLQLTALYGPYTTSGGEATPSDASPYTPAAASVSYNALPFSAAVGVSSAGASAPVTFSNATAIHPNALNISGAPFFANSSQTLWNVRWEMLPAPGDTAALPPVQETQVAIGASGNPANSWTLERGFIKTGRKVVLTVSMAPEAVTGCAPETLTSTFEYTLDLPKPQISISGCGNVGSSCTISAEPAAGATSAGWTAYKWTVNGSNAGTASSITPTFSSAGNYTIALTVSNALGETTVQQTVGVEPSLCGAAPSNVSFVYQGSLGCSAIGASCKPGETITFNPTAFGYTYQDCDTFAWTFGDGSSSSLKSPTKTYSSNGSYKVTLKVTNSTGTNSYEETLVIGSSTNPDPDPGPGTCSVPAAIYGSYTGNSSGCNLGSPSIACSTNETIRFAVDAGFSTIPSCATVAWNFGNGQTSTTRAPSIAYATPGTYNVRVQVSGGGVNRVASFNLTVAGATQPACPETAPGGFPDVSYSGPASGCSSDNDTNCSRDEAVTLKMQPWSYKLQSCDTIEWNFDDGSAPQTTTSTSVSHKFVGPIKRTYNVTAVIKNSKGSSSPGTVEVKFAGNPAVNPPTNAVITAPASAGTGKPVEFSGTASGEVTQWNWTFGDGTSSSQQNPTKTWETPGTYTVSLSAGNEGGVSIATHEIEVSDGKAFKFLLPAVARLEGQGGTEWRSDWLLFNPDPSFDPSDPLELEVELRGKNVQTKKTISMDSSTKVIEDVIKEIFELDSEVGSIIVSGVGEEIPQMWTRTYTVSASGVGTYGQLIPAVALDTTGNSTTVDGSYLIAGLRSSERFRTNIGVVNPSNEEIDVEVVVSDQELGLPLGSTQVKVAPYSLLQITDLPNRITKISGDKPYSVSMQALGGKQLIAYGSMIDNVSNDPVYIEAIPQAALARESNVRQVLPGIGRINSWHSDVTVFNADDKTIQVDLKYVYPVVEDGSIVIKTAEAKDVPLYANTFVQLDDVIAPDHLVGQLEPLPEGNSSGLLMIETKSSGVNRYPLIFGRTYNEQGKAGTYGQGIAAFGADDANVTTTSPAYLPGMRNDPKYRTNVGLIAIDDRPTRVKVTLLDATSGEGRESREYDLKPFESIIISDVFSNIGSLADRGSLKIEVVAGGDVWAFGSVIDKTTSDPEYVPAVSFK